MDVSSIKRHATLVPVTLTICTLIYLLTIYAKVPIRITLTTTPYLEIVVEINPEKSPSRLNFLQDAAGVSIADDREEKTTNDSSNPQYPRE